MRDKGAITVLWLRSSARKPQFYSILGAGESDGSSSHYPLRKRQPAAFLQEKKIAPGRRVYLQNLATHSLRSPNARRMKSNFSRR